jgi:tetratricopeptide (TPR) repeat protein
VRAFERELQHLSRDYWTLYYLAFLYEAEGQLDSAREKLQRALALQPRSADANALLGKVLLKQGKAKEAVPAARNCRRPNSERCKPALSACPRLSTERSPSDAAREFAEAQRLKDQGIEKNETAGRSHDQGSRLYPCP